MKGVVFNIFEDFIVSNWGAEAYEDILEAAKPSCPFFVGPGTYADEDFSKLVRAACSSHDIVMADAVRAFGTYAFPQLAERHPIFLEGLNNIESLLLNLDSVIHVEVLKLLPGAVLPRFEVWQSGEKQLKLEYRSPRQLCSFVEGLVDGASRYFNEPVRLQHSPCMHAGSSYCGFVIDIGDEETARGRRSDRKAPSA